MIFADDGYIAVKYGAVARLANVVPKTMSLIDAARQAKLKIINACEGYNADGVVYESQCPLLVRNATAH